MLQGKIIRDGQLYHVKVGGTAIDITDEVHALIKQAIDAFVERQTPHPAITDIIDRYNQISSIILAGGGGKPTA